MAEVEDTAEEEEALAAVKAAAVAAAIDAEKPSRDRSLFLTKSIDMTCGVRHSESEFTPAGKVNNMKVLYGQEPDTFEKRRREMEKKRKAEEKRDRRRKKKELIDEPTDDDSNDRNSLSAVGGFDRS